MAGDDFDLAAAGLRADTADLDVSIEALARKLEEALPRATRVERRGWRARRRRVARIEVTLGEDAFALEADGTGSRERRVRGVAIRREELDLGAWVRALTAELGAAAETSGEARAALERLLA